MLVVIAAMNKHRTIGLDGTMPWHCPEDLKFFKKITMGQTLIMGRKTYEGLPKVLKGRHILQVSRSDGDISDLDGFLKQHERSDDVVFVAGGGEVYRAALAYASTIYLSIIDNDVIGDTFFPEIGDDYKRTDTIAFETFQLQVFKKEGEKE